MLKFIKFSIFQSISLFNYEQIINSLQNYYRISKVYNIFMGKQILQKGSIKSSLSWFRSRTKKMFSRQQKQQKKTGNLEKLYEKFEKQEEISLKKEEEISKINFKKKNEVLEILLKKLRSQQNLHIKYQIRKKKIREYKQTKTLEEKQNQLVCPICIQFYVNAVPTICGHTFCKKCIEQALIFKGVCPVCRMYLRGNELIPCLAVNNIIKMHVQKCCDSSQKQIYEQRIIESQTWQKGRKISQLDIEIDKKIDVRDTQFIWCIGRIAQIYKCGNQIKEILIHYLGWNKIYDEIIDIKSPRLAPFNFYTSRNDINRYANNQNDENYYSYVVTGAQLLQQQQQQQQLQQQQQQLLQQQQQQQQQNAQNPQNAESHQGNNQHMNIENQQDSSESSNRIQNIDNNDNNQQNELRQQLEHRDRQVSSFHQRLMLRLLLNEIGLQNLGNLININISQINTNNNLSNSHENLEGIQLGITSVRIDLENNRQLQSAQQEQNRVLLSRLQQQIQQANIENEQQHQIEEQINEQNQFRDQNQNA